MVKNLLVSISFLFAKPYISYYSHDVQIPLETNATPIQVAEVTYYNETSSPQSFWFNSDFVTGWDELTIPDVEIKVPANDLRTFCLYVEGQQVEQTLIYKRYSPTGGWIGYHKGATRYFWIKGNESFYEITESTNCSNLGLRP